MMAFIAIGDLGSNSFRLGISKNIDGQYQVVDSLKEMIHFAAGLDENDNLDIVSQKRALECLERFGERLRGFKKNQVRIVATNTFRVAKNIEDFLPKAEAALKFPIEIIGGYEEARLIYKGVIHTLRSKEKKILVVDIGGGSTEFIVGTGSYPEIAESLPMGCVSYSKTFFSHENITQKHFKEAIHMARSTLQELRQEIAQTRWQLAIASSGTAKTIHALAMVKQPDCRGFNYDFLIHLKDQIVQYGNVEKAKLKEVKNSRSSVFAGGLAIMIAIFEELNIQYIEATEASLRDGVLYEFIGRQLDQDLRNETVNTFQNRYHVDSKQANRVTTIASVFFQSFIQKKLPDQELTNWKQFLIWAAQLHEVGIFISHASYQKHSAYILEHADMPGFSRTEQQILSRLIGAHRGDLKRLPLLANAPEPLWYAVLALRLATIFCRSRNPLTLPQNASLTYKKKSKAIVLHISKTWMRANPLTKSILETEALAWRQIDYHFSVKLT
ncbi:MAG: Ppx/GppA phosphatase family protein [Neisseriaceae bacterium]